MSLFTLLALRTRRIYSPPANAWLVYLALQLTQLLQICCSSWILYTDFSFTVKCFLLFAFVCLCRYFVYVARTFALLTPM